MTLFAPKCIYQTKSNLYMIGYNNTDRRVDAVNLKDITSIKLAFKHNDPKADMVKEWISDIIPQDHVPGECKEIIYEGPVTFRCRGQHVGDLYNRFGPPCVPIEKDARCRAIYNIQEATITSEELYWLSQIPDYNIRISGPESFVEAVQNYYSKVSKALLNPSMKAL